MQKRIAQLLLIITLASCTSKPQQAQTEEIHTDKKQTGSTFVGPDSLNAWIVDHPTDANALVARARVYIDRKNLKYAYADAQAAMNIDSLSPEVLLVWGDVNFLTNKTRNSKNAWEKCIRLDKKSIPCRLKLAELYNIVQEYGKSMQLVNEVLELDPNDPVAYFIKGINLRDANGDTNTAFQYIQKAIDLDNNYVTAIDMMGVLLSAKKDPLALAYFDRILALKPNDHTTYYNIGMFHLKVQDWNAAIQAFTTCTQINPQDFESLFNLGYIHLQLRRYDLARNYFSESLAAQPVNHRAMYGRAYAYEMLGDLNNADKDYREALTYNPQHEASKIGLKRVQELRGRP